MKLENDFLVIGSGIAGLSFALQAAAHGKVAIVTKRDISESATNYAQGGIATVSSKDDTFDAHVEDTLVAGAGICHEDVVRMVVEEGPAVISSLIDWGVKFTTSGDTYDLTREGGHSQRRILHAEDITGREIQRALVAAARANENITIYENHIGIDLITESKILRKRIKPNRCIGAHVLDIASGQVKTFKAKITLLATGGAGKVYLYTCNPDVATGDGVAMAYRAGATIANMEFMQFHPTTLYHPNAKSFLISEAVRGEGAILRRRDGTAFMEKYHHLKDLAPRDIVARAIDNEMKTYGDDCVFLDITHKDPEYVRNRFPNIYQTCLEYGLDMTKEGLPVVPAAHYLCGGVAVDTNAETDIQHLYAIGEVAFTGLHGANRLASNSLLEAAVYAGRAYAHAVQQLKAHDFRFPEIPVWDSGTATNSDEMVVVSQNWDEIRRFMWNYVGIVRSDKRLERAMHRIKLIQEEIEDYYWNFIVTSDLIELRNITTVAELIVRCARQRKESRGLHYNIDYADRDDIHWKKDTFVKKQF
ncbi:L-aspartate oxidase [Geotalea daltonii FRC-32]|uniref:L-aspartate oxidase n=1 Tax=Geotalea daltonii (strain DSM 22248 / JCM 15807 / FRC-32) TaxID=316067 RepID=B9M266_GEODF|nr:L-aspartate oxidase [Geotalea daltonii]ACM21184.1 L-aspartate oxidase [Geotalea daltonii FRC-32]